MENYKKKRNYKKWWVILIIIFVGIISGFFIYKSSVDDYEIVEEEKESLQFGYDRITVEAITEKKISKEQVESLLKDIANDVENRYPDYDNSEDEIFITLHVNKVHVGSVPSLGRLIHRENETEIESFEKNWSKKPSKTDYKLYNSFNTKFSEMMEDGDYYEKINTGEVDFTKVVERVSDNAKKEIAWEEDIEIDELQKSIDNVHFFANSDES